MIPLIRAALWEKRLHAMTRTCSGRHCMPVFGWTSSIFSKMCGKLKTTLSDCCGMAATSCSIPVSTYPSFTTTFLTCVQTKTKTGAMHVRSNLRNVLSVASSELTLPSPLASRSIFDLRAGNYFCSGCLPQLNLTAQCERARGWSPCKS